jgi:hypothetical protein
LTEFAVDSTVYRIGARLYGEFPEVEKESELMMVRWKIPIHFATPMAFFHAVGSIALLSIVGCGTLDQPRNPERGLAPILQAPADFDLALKQNQAALNDRKSSPDLALYNMGVLLSHPSNPKKDPAKALSYFKLLVAEHPESSYMPQAKTWVQVLEQQQKLAEERQKLNEEKRALNREREILAQERQKLNYSAERSWQLDMEVERRRRQSLSK